MTTKRVTATSTASEEGSPRSVSRVWDVMARRVTESWKGTPHFFLHQEVYVGNLMAWRDEIGRKSGLKVTYTDLLIKLVADMLGNHPSITASWVDGGIVWNEGINVGFAIAITKGLVVPVICSADAMDVVQIATLRAELVDRARSGKLRPVDLQNGTFTVSNMGMYGVDDFTAIINPPQSAILTAGRVAQRVVPLNGVPVVRWMIALTLSCDHRVVDGVHAARFIVDLSEAIENA